MTKNELRLILKLEGVKDNRIGNYTFSYVNGNVLLNGKIPLPLARKFQEGVDNEKLQICIYGGCSYWNPDDFATNETISKAIDELYDSFDSFFSFDVYAAAKNKIRHDYIKKLEEEGKIDEVYILYYIIKSEEGLHYVIKCIRDYCNS